MRQFGKKKYQTKMLSLVGLLMVIACGIILLSSLQLTFAASGGNDVSSDIACTHSKDLFIVRLGGLGGIVYITASVSVWKFENAVAGFGFLRTPKAAGLPYDQGSR